MIYTYPVYMISIHTLVKRVTEYNSLKTNSNIDFNSHSRKESDLGYDIYISSLYDFNSHSRKESDRI